MGTLWRGIASAAIVGLIAAATTTSATAAPSAPADRAAKTRQVFKHPQWTIALNSARISDSGGVAVTGKVRCAEAQEIVIQPYWGGGREFISLTCTRAWTAFEADIIGYVQAAPGPATIYLSVSKVPVPTDATEDQVDVILR